MVRLLIAALFTFCLFPCHAAMCELNLSGDTDLGSFKKSAIMEKTPDMDGAVKIGGNRVFSGNISCSEGEVAPLLTFNANAPFFGQPKRASLGNNSRGEELGYYQLALHADDLVIMNKTATSGGNFALDGNGNDSFVILNGSTPYLLAKNHYWAATRINHATFHLTLESYLYQKSVDHIQGLTPFGGHTSVTLSYL